MFAADSTVTLLQPSKIKLTVQTSIFTWHWHLRIFSLDFSLRRAKNGVDTEPGDVDDGRNEYKQLTETVEKILQFGAKVKNR